MSPKFHKVSFNSSQYSEKFTQSKSPLLKTMVKTLSKGTVQEKSAEENELMEKFSTINDEHASRLYLESYLLGMEGKSFHGMTSPEKPEVVPDFSLTSLDDLKLTGSKAAVFQQTENNIPIFGSRAVIEIDGFEKTLVSIEATLAEKPDVTAVASMSAAEALTSIFKTGKPQIPLSEAKVSPPKLVFFADQEADKWRLAYHFENLPVLPPEFKSPVDEEHDHAFCLGESPRSHSPFYDYFVDAHSGDVFYYFSSTPRLDVPVKCNGPDDEQLARSFYGLQNGVGFLLSDPLRSIKTYDFGFKDIDTQANQVPAIPIQHTSTNFLAHGPAISAHYNASLVFDFYNNELKRNGIDDKGMVLESVVNVYSSGSNQPHPTWTNAVWWNKKMWYGQSNGAAGQRSYARYLDVIGHELTHGVTETTSNLVYRNLSGALNESFSDIFGIMIKNWFPSRPLSNWDWELGKGLGRNGGSIRNLSNPSACGQPDHFSQYVPLPITNDAGGVHIYSGIHNLAAYHVLTAIDQGGAYIFPPNEVAILYYLTLTKLTRMSVFSDCRRTLLNVAGSYYQGNPTELATKTKAIADAYTKVGIR